MKKKLILFTLAATLVAAPAVFADAAATYKGKCAMCHGADGKGQTPMGKNMKLRDLGSAEVQKLSDADLTKIVADGKAKMPAFKAKLSADEIKGLVAFMRTLKK